jgi:hypothetical protein
MWSERNKREFKFVSIRTCFYRSKKKDFSSKKENILMEVERIQENIPLLFTKKTSMMVY